MPDTAPGLTIGVRSLAYGGEPLFEIAEDEMEIGIGIHGEPGRERVKIVSATEIVDILLDAVVPDLPFGSGDEVALMINGLGGTPISELYLLYGIAHQKLADQGINVFRSYVNEYCTSLDMAGASATRGIPEAAVLSLAAGVDLLCLGPDHPAAAVRDVQAAIVAAVRDGRLTRGRIPADIVYGAPKMEAR